MTRRTATLVTGGAVLLLATVLAFRAFDRHSHSASDTLRPFVLTMVPVWAIAFAGARAFRRRRD